MPVKTKTVKSDPSKKIVREYTLNYQEYADGTISINRLGTNMDLGCLCWLLDHVRYDLTKHTDEAISSAIKQGTAKYTRNAKAKFKDHFKFKK